MIRHALQTIHQDMRALWVGFLDGKAGAGVLQPQLRWQGMYTSIYAR